MIDYSRIERLHAAARRERSAYVHCLIERAKLWIVSLLSGVQLGAPRCCPAV
jgi:hypothetical protein